MNELSKSLQELDAVADELLKKSKGTLKPTDIADDSEDSDDSDDSKVEKCGKSCKPDGDNLKKSDSDEESEDADKDSSDTSDDDDSDDNVTKSLETYQNDLDHSFREDEDISKGVDSSEFQAALVTSTVKALGEMQYDFHNKNRLDEKVNNILAKSFQAIISSNTKLKSENERLNRRIDKLEKSLEKGFGSVMDALDSMSTQPAHVRKSVGSLNVYDKDFNKSINGNGADNFNSLSKSQVMSILNTELYSGNSMVQPSDIISYESGAPLRPELKTLVVNKSK